MEIHLKSEHITIIAQRIPYGVKPSIHDIYRTESLILRNDNRKVLLPGEFMELHNKALFDYEGEVSIEPRIDSPVDGEWPQPHISRVIQGVVRIPNLSDKPVLIDKAQHFAYIRRVIVADSVSEVIPFIDNKVNLVNSENKSSIENDGYSFKSVTVDPDNLCSENEKLLFTNIN